MVSQITMASGWMTQDQKGSARTSKFRCGACFRWINGRRNTGLLLGTAFAAAVAVLVSLQADGSFHFWKRIRCSKIQDKTNLSNRFNTSDWQVHAPEIASAEPADAIPIADFLALLAFLALKPYWSKTAMDWTLHSEHFNFRQIYQTQSLPLLPALPQNGAKGRACVSAELQKLHICERTIFLEMNILTKRTTCRIAVNITTCCLSKSAFQAVNCKVVAAWVHLGAVSNDL